MLGLETRFVVPDLSGPGVLRHHGKEDDRGLVVHAPGGESLPVERTLELGVEALGVLPHAVEAAVIEACGGRNAQVLGAVELRLDVLSCVEKRFPPVMPRMAGAGQGVVGVELVPDGAVLVAGGVALGLVTGELPVLGLAVDVDDLLGQGACGGPKLRTSILAAAWARDPLGGLTVSVAAQLDNDTEGSSHTERSSQLQTRPGVDDVRGTIDT